MTVVSSESSSSIESIYPSTVFSFLFFGTNFLFFILFQILKKVEEKDIKKTENSPSELTAHTHSKKKLSVAFDGTLSCYTSLTTELCLTGGIIILTYIFENHWIFPHSEKEYSRDLFLFVCVVFFLYALFTIKPITDLSLLGRDQTEEWKGWMQFIFLLYHYFHAEEVYNSVRVMITCYVWMTGFGNFSFFYMKQDYGWLRVVQMLWRLNFAVFFLMLVHGNTYILYYICPLHTFYFLLVYTTMYIWSSVNHSMWGIRFKLLVVGVIIYLVWDVSGDIFDTFFFFLGRESVVGAKLGTLWEWYFRSSLDHWSTYYGMIFALNFPLAEQYFRSASPVSLTIAGTLLLGLSIWWYNEIYSLDKVAYNLNHSYFAFIPLLTYIFFRNLTPSIRSGVSMSLHVLGKTTLETYLLQHHVWLTSNAKTLLTLVPDMPWVNFALCSVLFYYLSHELYRLTMSLRGMILPENKDLAWRNMIGTFFLFVFFGVITSIVVYFGIGWTGIGLTCLFLFLVLSVPIRLYGKGIAENELFAMIWKRMFLICSCLFFLGVIIQLTANQEPSISEQLQSTIPLPYSSPALISQCEQRITAGSWDLHSMCPPTVTGSPAHCAAAEWKWLLDEKDGNICRFHQMKSSELLAIFKNSRVVFLGDSSVRLTYHRFNHLLDQKYKDPTLSTTSVSVVTPVSHRDFSQVYSSANLTVEFHWFPYMRNITTYFQSTQGERGVVYIMGGILWDALHIKDPQQIEKDIKELHSALQGTNIPKQNLYWIDPLTVINSRLNTVEKQNYMTENVVSKYRSLFASSFSSSLTLLSTGNFTQSREDLTIDGVHYSPEIYDVIGQVYSNHYLLTHYTNSLNSPSGSTPANTKPNPYPNGKPTGSMSNREYGFIVLFFATIMLFTWDSFLGAGILSLKLTGKGWDWNEAYGPLLKKLFPSLHGHDGDEESKPMLLEMKQSTD